jgi:DNA processing protein
MAKSAQPDERRALSDAERLDWLRLIRSDRVGPVTFRQLLVRFGGARDALDALPDLARRGGASGRLRICSKMEAQRELETLQAMGARLLGLWEPDYPEFLVRLEDAPPLLCLRGHSVIWTKRCVAMVGARNASANGRRLAQQIARDLAAENWVVVSGLARGIDAAAHEGALDGGTVAVMAGGVDIIYPEEHAKLYGAIEACGAIVSEMPPGTVPQARHFPRRNRLISGLSIGTVVVEAAPRSGSLITARFAGEQGREVMAVPGSPLDPRARGCNQLIREGATLVESAADIIEALSRQAPSLVREPNVPEFLGSSAADLDEGQLALARRELTELLGPTPVAVDELLRQCQVSPALVHMVLLELELAGQIERHPGNRVAMIAGAPGPL